MRDSGQGLVAEVAEMILAEMRSQDVNKTELARRLGRSRAYVTQLLDGTTNMTISTIEAVLGVLGKKPRLFIDRPRYEQTSAPGDPGTGEAGGE